MDVRFVGGFLEVLSVLFRPQVRTFYTRILLRDLDRRTAWRTPWARAKKRSLFCPFTVQLVSCLQKSSKDYNRQGCAAVGKESMVEQRHMD
jgi:hypothetical protein